MAKKKKAETVNPEDKMMADLPKAEAEIIEAVAEKTEQASVEPPKPVEPVYSVDNLPPIPLNANGEPTYTPSAWLRKWKREHELLDSKGL